MHYRSRPDRSPAADTGILRFDPPKVCTQDLCVRLGATRDVTCNLSAPLEWFVLFRQACLKNSSLSRGAGKGVGAESLRSLFCTVGR